MYEHSRPRAGGVLDEWAMGDLAIFRSTKRSKAPCGLDKRPRMRQTTVTQAQASRATSSRREPMARNMSAHSVCAAATDGRLARRCFASGLAP